MQQQQGEPGSAEVTVDQYRRALEIDNDPWSASPREIAEAVRVFDLTARSVVAFPVNLAGRPNSGEPRENLARRDRLQPILQAKAAEEPRRVSMRAWIGAVAAVVAAIASIIAAFASLA